VHDVQRTGAGAELGYGICSNRSNYPAPWELRSDQLTILVNGFIEARLPLLQQSLKTYSTSPAVHSIIVLWSNTSTPSTSLPHFETLGAPISIIRQATTSLNDRFLPRQSIKTKAVVICDDDITVELPHLEFALQVWRENQNRIVGFFPRAHSFSIDSHSWIYIKNSKKYSIMLTKIMILATEYLWKYSCEMPVGVKEYVDHGMNCEDIAMNFLVSNSRPSEGSW
jgi:alpha-1,4-N-acetylglucosaminyltransferase EXTL3